MRASRRRLGVESGSVTGSSSSKAVVIPTWILSYSHCYYNAHSLILSAPKHGTFNNSNNTNSINNSNNNDSKNNITTTILIIISIVCLFNTVTEKQSSRSYPKP